MNKTKTILFALLVSIIPIMLFPVFADDEDPIAEPITMQIDKKHYFEGDSITVTGQFSDDFINKQILLAEQTAPVIEIISPTGDLLFEKGFLFNIMNGSFWVSSPLGPYISMSPGIHTVMISWGEESVQTTFQYGEVNVLNKDQIHKLTDYKA